MTLCSDDTLGRVLSLLLEHVEPEGAALCFLVCKPWMHEMEARGFCNTTVQLCSTLAQGGKLEHLQRQAKRLDGNVCFDGNAFLQRSWEWRGGIAQWLQAASQEPDASFLSRGAASTARALGLPLVRWVGKPQGKYPGVFTLPNLSENVRSIEFSPDGTRVASGSEQGRVKIWDIATGALLWSTPIHDCKDGCICTKDQYSRLSLNLECPATGHSGIVNSIAFSPDGERVVSGAEDNLIKVWDAATGAVVCRGSHSRGVTAAAFFPDGTRVASGSVDGFVKIWEIATGALVHSLGEHNGKNGCICAGQKRWKTNPDCMITRHSKAVILIVVSPDGKQIVSGAEDNLVKRWDADTGAEVSTLAGHPGWGRFVVFSPYGNIVVTAYNDNLVKIWDLETRDEVGTLRGCACLLLSVKFSRDGKRIVTGSNDHLVRLWNAATGAEVSTLAGHSGWTQAVAFSPDSKWVVSASDDTLVKIWDVETEAEVRTGHSKRVLSVAISPDGKWTVSGSADTLVKIWDVATGAEVRTLMGHSEGIFSVAFSPDGKRVVSIQYDNLMKIWDAATGAEVCTMVGVSGWVKTAEFSPDGKWIVSGSSDTPEWIYKHVTIWDTETGAVVRTLMGHSDDIFSVAFSADGKRVVSGSKDRTVKIWDAATGALVRTIGHTGEGRCLCKTWDRGGDAGCPVGGHRGEVKAVAISPAGNLVASGGGYRDNLVKVWDANSGAEVCTLAGHTSSVTWVAFSDDAAHVVSGGLDNMVCFWDIASGTEVCQVAGSAFAFVAGAATSQHHTNQRVLTAIGDTLLIVELLPQGSEHVEDGAALHAPAACFKAPQPITTVRCNRATICVGCHGGAVCMLQAPFLAL